MSLENKIFGGGPGSGRHKSAYQIINEQKSKGFKLYEKDEHGPDIRTEAQQSKEDRHAFEHDATALGSHAGGSWAAGHYDNDEDMQAHVDATVESLKSQGYKTERYGGKPVTDGNWGAGHVHVLQNPETQHEIQVQHGNWGGKSHAVAISTTDWGSIKSSMKTTDKIFAHSADELTLNDLQQAVCAAAKADGRFNTGGDNNSFCPWCVDILRDEDVDSWSAVIQGCDGKMYEVPFTISEDNGSITLGTSAIPVNRKTAYVAASQGKTYLYNGEEVVKAGGPGSGRKGNINESDDSMPPIDKTEADEHLKESEKYYPGDERDAHEASAKAYTTGTKEDHLLAMKKNRMASANSYHGHDEKFDAIANQHESLAKKLKATKAEIMKNSIRAAGTTDGAAKGHAAKKSQAASDASADAHEASQKAFESGEDDDHNAAKDAHEDASEAHKKAMLAHAKVNNEQEASDHAKHMTAHDACADGHCRSDSDAVEAALKTIGLTIKAKKPEVLRCRANGNAINPSKDWKQGEEVTFMYMPGGVTTIQAGFRSKAINITVDVDEDAAKTIQASFDNLKSEAPKQKPFGDVEHKEEEASLHPLRFEWGTYDDTDGVLVAAEPTALGERNVNGKIHRSWSPSFTTDADYSRAKEKGGIYSFPEGVRGSTSNPAKITGIDFCIGTLTNKPAFQNMPPVKAKKNNGNEHQPLTSSGVLKQLAPVLPTKKVMKSSDVFKQLAGKTVKAAEEQSEADKKSDTANDLSKQATEASHDAMQSGDKDDHDKASALHEKASKAHAAAMVAHTKDGNDDEAKKHATMMNVHDAVAEAHDKKDNQAVEASLPKNKVISIETVFAQLRGTAGPHAATTK